VDDAVAHDIVGPDEDSSGREDNDDDDIGVGGRRKKYQKRGKYYEDSVDRLRITGGNVK
jgi:hypothetical protein